MDETGLPLPLGANGIRKDLGPEAIREVNRLLKESIRYGLAHRKAALDYAQAYGRDLDRAKADTFVGMYVNDWTLDFGERGRAGRARAAGPRTRGRRHPQAGRAGVRGVKWRHGPVSAAAAGTARFSTAPAGLVLVVADRGQRRTLAAGAGRDISHAGVVGGLRDRLDHRPAIPDLGLVVRADLSLQTARGMTDDQASKTNAFLGHWDLVLGHCQSAIFHKCLSLRR